MQVLDTEKVTIEQGEIVTERDFGLTSRTFADVKMSFSRLMPEPKEADKKTPK